MRFRTDSRVQHRRDAPGGTRTPDQQLRRLPLYPSELLAPALPLVPLAGSRTWILYGSATSDTSYHEIGAAGFEPATSCSQSRRDTGLRYAPQISGRVCYPAGAPRSTGARKSVATSCTHDDPPYTRAGHSPTRSANAAGHHARDWLAASRATSARTVDCCSNAAKARPRWLTRAFASRPTSANVAPRSSDRKYGS